MKIVTVAKERIATALKKSSEIFKDYKLTLLLILIWTVTGIAEDVRYYNGTSENVKQIAETIDAIIYFVVRCSAMIGVGTFFLELRY